MVRFASLLLLLAACPPKPPATAVPPQPAGAGCPAASGVFIASFVTQEPGKGRSGWVLPLHAMKIDPGATSTVPDYAPLDATAAGVSGVPAAPTGNLWLVTAEGPPCRVQLGGYYAAKLPGPPASISYGAELEGCPAPADPQDAGGVVLVSQDSPGACRFETPNPVASRLGTMDAQKQWQRPTKETAIPPALASIVPPHDCKAPTCEMLWAIGQADVGGQPVAWSGAVNWLAVGDPANACGWKAEHWSGFFVPGPDGKPIKIEEGQDHPLVLSAVLVDGTAPPFGGAAGRAGVPAVDGGGAKALLAEGPGEFATYDLAPGKATLAHHVTWMLAPNEAWDMVDHLGPLCEPPEAKPAPLPKDAKPISPYP